MDDFVTFFREIYCYIDIGSYCMIIILMKTDAYMYYQWIARHMSVVEPKLVNNSVSMWHSYLRREAGNPGWQKVCCWSNFLRTDL